MSVMRTAPGELNGVRKAAVVALAVGEEISASIFKHLTEDEIETLRVWVQQGARNN